MSCLLPRLQDCSPGKERSPLRLLPERSADYGLPDPWAGELSIFAGAPRLSSRRSRRGALASTRDPAEAHARVAFTVIMTRMLRRL